MNPTQQVSRASLNAGTPTEGRESAAESVRSPQPKAASAATFSGRLFRPSIVEHVALQRARATRETARTIQGGA